VKKQIKPGIYEITRVDSKGKKYKPEKPYETYRTITVGGVRKKEWECFASFAEAKAFHNSTAKRSAVTLREVWNHYKANAKLEVSTVRKLDSQVTHLEPIMDLALDEHTPKTVTEWLTALSKPEYVQNLKGTRVSFLNELALVKLLYGYARENFSHEFHSPVLKRHKKEAVFRTAPVKEEKDLSVREIGAFLSHLPGLFRVLAEVQYALYARIQEAAAIHYEDFDPKSGLVVLRRRVVWPRRKGQEAFIQFGLKAGEEKRLKSLHAAKLLQAHCIQHGIRSGLVFQLEGRILSYREIQYRYDEAHRLAGHPQRGTHIMRHAALTEHYQETKDIYGTMAAAGHARVDTTQGYAKHRGATPSLMDEKLRRMRGEVG
jgi:integrase